MLGVGRRRRDGGDGQDGAEDLSDEASREVGEVSWECRQR